MRWAQALGPLRLALLVLAVVVLALMPVPGTKAAFAGWAMIPTVVLPVLAPLVFLGLLLDALMSSVFLIDAESLKRSQLRTAMLIDLAVAVVLISRWLPYYMALRV